jgi:hypothetical protein
MVKISPEFWKSLTRDEFMSVCCGGLGPELCKRLWRMDRLQGDPPEYLLTTVLHDDVMMASPPRHGRDDVMRPFPPRPTPN